MVRPLIWFLGGLLLTGWASRTPGQDAGGTGRQPEGLVMAMAILDGSAMRGQGFGWFKAGEIQYGWPWLAAERDGDGDGAVTRGEWHGPAADFDRLDRNHDRVLKPDDFDWSDASVFARQGEYFRYHFRRIDTNKDARISQSEWDAFFALTGEGKDYLTADDFRDAWTIAPPAAPPSLLMRGPGGPTEGETDEWAMKRTLLTGLARSEIGSMAAGPALGDLAPDFTLKTRDGAREITLSEVVRAGKPVVLVLGNYTCGPFRRQFPQIDALSRRYADRATFLLVYVREAHPINGWRMDDNDQVGIAVAQPTDYDGRVALAETCGQVLKPSMPVLVDTMNDRVGHLYSGMPSRLYVIDSAGHITYKAGRGPYGLRPGEMEQSLILTLQATPKPE